MPVRSGQEAGATNAHKPEATGQGCAPCQEVASGRREREEGEEENQLDIFHG